MLIKMMSGGADYDKNLRLRLVLGLAFLAVGIVGFLCWFFLVPDSGLNEHARGYYLGAATGVTLGAVILLARVLYLMRRPEARRRARIQDTDERRQHIIRSAAQVAGVAAFMAAACLTFVVIPFNEQAAHVLLGVMAVYSLVWLAAAAWLSRKL